MSVGDNGADVTALDGIFGTCTSCAVGRDLHCVGVPGVVLSGLIQM